MPTDVMTLPEGTDLLDRFELTLCNRETAEDENSLVPYEEKTIFTMARNEAEASDQFGAYLKSVYENAKTGEYTPETLMETVFRLVENGALI